MARLNTVPDDVHGAFLNLWVESKDLPRRAEDRKALAAALRRLFPAVQSTSAIRLFRGTDAAEVRRRIKGFSWSADIEVAKGFAARCREWEGGGVVLQALAPPEAILLIRDDPVYYDEREVVVDPFRLGAVVVVERHRSDQPWQPPAGEATVSRTGIVGLRARTSA